MLKFKQFADSPGSHVDESLSIAQRRKTGIRTKRFAKKIKRLRDKKLRRVADKDTIAKRSQRSARHDMFKKFSKGKARGAVSVTQRRAIDKKVDRLSNIVSRQAVRKRPETRKLDRERKKAS